MVAQRILKQEPGSNSVTRSFDVAKPGGNGLLNVSGSAFSRTVAMGRREINVKLNGKTIAVLGAFSSATDQHVAVVGAALPVTFANQATQNLEIEANGVNNNIDNNDCFDATVIEF